MSKKGTEKKQEQEQDVPKESKREGREIKREK